VQIVLVQVFYSAFLGETIREISSQANLVLCITKETFLFFFLLPAMWVSVFSRKPSEPASFSALPSTW